MPQEPKRRHSRERKGKRRAGIKLEILKTIFCPNCKNIILPHTICKFCGFYKGTDYKVGIRLHNKRGESTTNQLTKKQEDEKPS